MNHDHRDPRLLAIDDSDLIHRLLRARLKHENIEIHSATNGESGVAMARSLLPDVILLDVELPGMDGFAVLEALKADTATGEIPVIFLSTSTDARQRICGLDMGAVDFVTKPFDLAELRARVRGAIRTHRLIRMLAQRAQIDGLTGLWNRTYLNERMVQEIAEATRHNQPLAFIIADLDNFKKINDTYGHTFGDRVLEEVAGVLADSRQSDIHCRYGGEEFAIIAPHTTVHDAGKVADRIRQQVQSLCWSSHKELVVTMSFGVADLTCVDHATVEGLISAADRALYSAKDKGRNRVNLAVPVVSAGAQAIRLSA